MNISTKIKRLETKGKIIKATEPLLHQIAQPYDGEKLSLAFNTYFKTLDDILNIKLEA